ncbi:hypothetical protein U1Q18_051736 [Sarracenia purpurea var. burkii]
MYNPSALIPNNMSSAVVSLTPPSLETFSFQCQDQKVKVDSNIYHLDRLRSSLKSNFFEKILTSGDFKLKNDAVLEIQPKNSEVFPSIVDLINGRKELIDVLNKDNYLPLVKAMDNLEMEIDLTIVNRFIDDNLKLYSLEEANIFELYNFIRKNGKFEYLLTSTLAYFSNNMTTLHNNEVLSSMPLDHLIRIIKSVGEVDDEKRCAIVQTCTKWLCCDLENRLPHMVILINSIKPGFHNAAEDKNSASIKCLPKTNVDELAKQEIIARCVFALLAYGGKLNPTILDYEYELERRRAEYEEYEQNKSPPIFVNCNNEYDKLKKIPEKWRFFRYHVAKCDGIATHPCKDKEYLLDGVDQSSFDVVMNYIYFDKDNVWEFRGIARVFKTADILKIEDLLKSLEKRLKDYHEKVGSQDVSEILNYTYGKKQYDDLYVLYLCKHVSTTWPEIDNMSQFCSISWTMFENVLKSPKLRLDAPHKILDICSTWVIHDVANRYSYLPRIAQIINPNCEVDEEKYKTEAAAELKCHSQQLVRDKLWQILSSIPYTVTLAELSNSRPKKHEEIPVFVVESEAHTIDVLNVDFDEIASFSPTLKSHNDSKFRLSEVKSATMIHNNLFILLNSYYSCTFLVYNFSLKKCFPLPFPFAPLRSFWRNAGYTLLTCNNEIYCCSDSSVVVKFSMQLNRWMIISKHEFDKNYGMFTSDGETLYRMYQLSKKGSYSSYVVEPYDFEKNVWSCESRLPTIENIIPNIKQLNVVKGKVAVSTYAEIILFNCTSEKWRHCDLPHELWKGSGSNLFAHCEDEMLIVIKNELYNISLSSGNCELKKSVPSKYKYLKFIHRL